MDTRRRELLAAALGSAGVIVPGTVSSAAGADDGNAQVLGEIREELRRIRAACCEVPAEVQRIRDVQHTFLRSTSKFPDVIEVGTHYWQVVYDWLRQSPQPADVMQLANGRYTMRFGFTTLILRPDTPPEFLGTAQDRS